MVDRQQAQEIAAQVDKKVKDCINAMEEIQFALSKVYASAVENDREEVMAAARGVISAEAPFDRVHSIVRGIVAGNVGWSAETDGKRMPEYIDGLLEENDTVYFLQRLIKALDNDGVIDYEADEVRDIGGGLLKCVSEMREEIEPLIGAYGA